jgi:hypothetical protein
MDTPLPDRAPAPLRGANRCRGPGPAAPDRSGDRGYGQRVRLIDRRPEKQALDSLLDSVRAGLSGALVLRGEPGVGKSALLDHAVERAADLQIFRTVAVQSEKTLGFAAVHQLLLPLLRLVDRLSEPQQRASAWPSGW